MRTYNNYYKYFLINNNKIVKVNYMFKVFDENNDMKISFEEIISVLKQEKIEFSEKMIKSVFALSDDNKDGKIERKEFTSVIKLFYAE